MLLKILKKILTRKHIWMHKTCPAESRADSCLSPALPFMGYHVWNPPCASCTWRWCCQWHNKALRRACCWFPFKWFCVSRNSQRKDRRQHSLCEQVWRLLQKNIHKIGRNTLSGTLWSLSECCGGIEQGAFIPSVSLPSAERYWSPHEGSFPSGIGEVSIGTEKRCHSCQYLEGWKP